MSTGRFKCFCRPVWQANPDWPFGYEPLAVPMDSCRILARFDDQQDAIDWCGTKNMKWRKFDYRNLEIMSDRERRIYFTAKRYEWDADAQDDWLRPLADGRQKDTGTGEVIDPPDYKYAWEFPG